jgi:hypothetical protein
MMAIFYFGFENIYSVNDDRIKWMTGLSEQNDITVDPEKAVHYRSYLALYL